MSDLTTFECLAQLDAHEISAFDSYTIVSHFRSARDLLAASAAEAERLRTKLVAADILAATIDQQVQRKTLGSRSAISDARLQYGEPWQYEFAPANLLAALTPPAPEPK